ncbi:hypothetical protein [Clostridium butyricum]|uniref:Uncharacterized protein n=1 Tax=Clostridium butyricum TaxID=1492 RepID=A0A6N3ETG1_CLOBU|nr:hypothetical protein [Clostridium butyricum]MBZ5746607.1 hypothetical protein [Clostridium butyricum]MDI9209518.1 hypothetical protein [Clostridium butyricum]QMW90781.1 hypothetical protein FF104_07350 [Clostridium butyricum]BBK77087.1 hypothetical protein Cbu04g_20950 [Clostridium butyricum]GEQ25434.1 hypothetical protein CBU03nite_18570 [Clostridium butyricum]
MRNNIINFIADDLKIKRYKDEELHRYISRVTYSAVGMWIRAATLDENILDDKSYSVGKSKKYIINRCSSFLENMIQIYPEINEWLNTNHKRNPIEIIRKRLERGNELVDVGYNTDLALPYYRECPINNSHNVIRGIRFEKFNVAIGLTQIKRNDNEIYDKKKLYEFYGISLKKSNELLDEYLNEIQWIEKKNLKDKLFFNKNSNKILSECWEYRNILMDGEITLYKDGLLNFGFVKSVGNNIYTSSLIDRYLVTKFEVRRFMYALKKESNNCFKAQFKNYEEDNLVMLRLFSALPQKEEDTLMLLGWPVNSIEDKYNLLFDKNCWEFVKSIITNLEIELEEV